MPAETTEQYIARIVGFSEGQDPLDVLRATPLRLRELRAAFAPERWVRQQVPGQWSPGQVLAHLADAEVVAGWRLRSILATDGVALQPFDQDVWAGAFKYADVDVDEALVTFTTLRTSLLSLLGRVDRARLEHHGMHAERGRDSIGHLMRLYAGHDLNHLSQIETRLRA
jgi:hypothetical protein